MCVQIVATYTDYICGGSGPLLSRDTTCCDMSFSVLDNAQKTVVPCTRPLDLLGSRKLPREAAG